MPIKLPKGFSRRKSSGTVLEEVENPPEPSFRVFERPAGGSKSFDGGIALKRMSQGRPLSSPISRVNENSFDDGKDSTSRNPRWAGDGGNGWRSVLTHGRESGGTNHSSSTGCLYDTSSSSARFSSTSTLPSSTDVTPEEPHPTGSKMVHELPIPPIPESQPAFSVRAGGRTFSFGRKAAQPPSPSTTHAEAPGKKATVRERATTTSSFASASTATPPKLLDTDLSFGGSDFDGFGKMFESFGKRRSRALGEQDTLPRPDIASPESIAPSAPAVPPRTYFNEKPRYTPPPINIDRTRDIESSPYSWGSHNSRDGLMSSPSPPAASKLYEHEESPPVPRHANIRTLTPYKTKPSAETDSPPSNARPERPSVAAGPGLRRSGAYAPKRPSVSLEDEDARLISNSARTGRVPNQGPAWETGPRGLADKGRDRDENYENGGLSTSSSNFPLQTPPLSSTGSSSHDNGQMGSAAAVRHAPVALFDSEESDMMGVSNSWRIESNETTPRARKLEPVRQEESLIFDPSLTEAARLTAQYAEREPQSPTKQSPRHKVMTPAQFERYRQEQEMSRTRSFTSKSEASEDDSDDDEDETERNRQAARQRRKQEAHLAVYRQQMMKVTGEQPSDLPMGGPSRPGLDRGNMPASFTSSRMSTINLGVEKPQDSGRSSDDEDEDVPLGILAAHGFPSKVRPPIQVGHTNSSLDVRASSYGPPPASGSVAGESIAGGARNTLPVFARNLPQEPYYGASLVNPSNRESLKQGGGSVYGGSQPNHPPGGLVGVIAGEERARAMRRGSPNAQGVYGPPGAMEAGQLHLPAGMQRHMAMGPMPGMPGMPPMPMMSPGDQAQAQISQQMTQMMQMQMQWMQQMMQMQGIQPNGQQSPPEHQMPTPQMPPQQLMNNNFLSPPGQMQRPMSMGSSVAQNLPGPRQMNQRAMSMVDPGMSQWQQQNPRNSTISPSMRGGLGGQSYAPSIAPSERSNIGMPSRYRPVSIAPEPEGKKVSSRTSTFTSGTLQGWTGHQEGPSATRPLNPRKPGGTESDDDEDEAWVEMKKKREKKKSSWKLKKTTNGFQGMFYPSTE